MKIAFCPPGETSNMSMSSGYVWLRPLICTFTSEIAPLIPDTTQFDGYGVAGPLSLIVIAPLVQSAEGVLTEAGRADAREVSLGATELVPAPARMARTRPKSTVPVARMENSVTRRPSAVVILPSPERWLIEVLTAWSGLVQVASDEGARRPPDAGASIRRNELLRQRRPTTSLTGKPRR